MLKMTISLIPDEDLISNMWADDTSQLSKKQDLGTDGIMSKNPNL